MKSPLLHPGQVDRGLARLRPRVRMVLTPDLNAVLLHLILTAILVESPEKNVRGYKNVPRPPSVLLTLEPLPHISETLDFLTVLATPPRLTTASPQLVIRPPTQPLIVVVPPLEKPPLPTRAPTQKRSTKKIDTVRQITIRLVTILLTTT